MEDETSPPPTDTKGGRTRTDIVRAAHDLIIQNGYHGTSMRKIATQAGIALGGIYNHFGSKEDVFQEVVLTYHPYHELLPILANTEHDNVEDLLRHAAQLIDETLTTRPELINLMFIEMVEFRSKHIPVLLQQVFPVVAQILQRFTETGNNLRPIPLPMLMRTFIGTMFGYFITKNFLGEQIPHVFHENALEYFMDAYLHGIVMPGINQPENPT